MTTSVRPCDSPAVRNRSIALPFYTKFLQRSAGPAAETAVFAGPSREALSAPILHRFGRAAELLGGRVSTRFELVLDRFVPWGGGNRAIDLATGDLVFLRVVAPRGQDNDGLRAQTAARISSLRIPGMAVLADYGAGNRDEWVEAYRLGPPGAEAGCAHEPPPDAGAVARLLARAGCAVRELRRRGARDAAPPGLFIPEPLDRVSLCEPMPGVQPLAASAGAPAIGTSIERRDETDPVVEWITGRAEAGAWMLRIDAPEGAGTRTFFAAIAREARLAGFVPVSSGFCGEAVAQPPGFDGAALCAALRDRHVIILDASAPRALSPDGAGIARFLSRLDTACGRPHAVVCRGLPVRGAPSIALGPMQPAQLRRSLLCAGIDEVRAARAIDKATRQSGGWPGAFAVLVRGLLGIRAAEEPYRLSAPHDGACAVREAAPQPCHALTSARAAGEQTLAVLARACGLVERGRHAAAERLLRRAVGYLHRRRRLADEARAQLALGRLLLARGRRQGAREAFEESRRLSDAARDTPGVLRALLHLGAADIEEGALPAAESVLRTAEVGAAGAALGDLGRAAALLLARCLFWQGRHDDAWQLVDESRRLAGGRTDAAAVAERSEAGTSGTGWGAAAAAGPDPPGLSAVEAEVGVRIALARRDAGLAARRLAAADEARDSQDPLHAGCLIALRLLVQGALGDTNGIKRTAASGLELARRLHAPLAAHEVRLGELEALIEAGARAEASACLRRLSGRSGRAVSGLAGLRLHGLAARLQGLESGRARLDVTSEGTVDTEAILRILQHCHEAQSEEDAVAGVCQTVKTALGAGAVSAFALVEGALRLVATAGHRACRPDLAERAAHSLLVVGPEESASGLELAAPVRYGGAAIGALAVRWAPAAAGREARARGIMAAAAAAIGPATAALSSASPGNHDAEPALGDLGGPSATMADLRRQVGRAAAAPYPVLVLGESGTGKELIAKAVHAGSARRARRFCAVNCAALSDDLFETELFGHARGAFTGAASDRPGLFEDADGGTLFLDEVGELSPRAQAKLLRAIQEGEIRRVGENHPRRVDTRNVAATNRLLSDDVRAGRFRHDLLYRLDVVRIVVPPLRERPEDVGPLARQFWREAMRRTGGQAELSPATIAALARYDWPGNVRELQNTLAALSVHAPPRGRVGPSRLPAAIVGSAAHAHGEPLTLAEARRRFEERFVRATLARTGGHRTEAASALGVSRQGLAKLIARLGISRENGAALY